MSRPLLQVEGLEKSFETPGVRGRRLRAVDGVGFTLQAGETLALVGESGCGKTTVGRLLLRLIEADAGRIAFDGIDVRALDRGGLRALRRRMQIVFQDPFASLDPRQRVGEAIAAPIRLHRLRAGEAVEARVDELLRLVGLDPVQKRLYPHEFSGGQRQRLVIARALAVEPDLLVCDEPVAALDVSVQAQILNLLQELRARLGLAMIFISHDMAVVRHIADRVGVMYAGRVVETGPARAVFAMPCHPYTQALLAAVPAASPRDRAPRQLLEGEPPDPFAGVIGCAFAGRCPLAILDCLGTRPQPVRASIAEHEVACLRAVVARDAGIGLVRDDALSPRVMARIAAMRERRERPPA
jgi:oligopeptide/dipeptide ABC transporter ATP-binding protein